MVFEDEIIDDISCITYVYPFIYQVKREFTFKVKMKDIALMCYFLGLKVWKKKWKICWFGYRQLVGSLVFLVNTQLGICLAMNTLSQFISKPHSLYCYLLIYLRDIINYGRRYIIGKIGFHGYFDVDWASSVVDGKSTYWCYISWDLVLFHRWKTKFVSLGAPLRLYIYKYIY